MQGDNREEFPRRAFRKGPGRRAYQAVFRAGAVLVGSCVLFASGFLIGLYRAAPARPAAGPESQNSVTAVYEVPPAMSSPAQAAAASSSPAAPTGGNPVTEAKTPPSPEELLAVMRWPADGRIVREPGWVSSDNSREWTYLPGVDIQVESGAPVKAVLDGKVKSIIEEPLVGKVILVSHGGGLESAYGRLAVTIISQGSAVSKGDVLGTAGREPVYFGISRDGEALDPVDYLTSAK